MLGIDTGEVFRKGDATTGHTGTSRTDKKNSRAAFVIGFGSLGKGNPPACRIYASNSHF